MKLHFEVLYGHSRCRFQHMLAFGSPSVIGATFAWAARVNTPLSDEVPLASYLPVVRENDAVKVTALDVAKE